MDVGKLSFRLIGAIIEVHRQLGPGLPESVYHEALILELEERGIPYETEVWVPVVYKDRALKSKYRIDLRIGGVIIVELKSVEAISPVHEAQLLTYLRLSGCRLGILVNFNVVRAVDGIHRKVLKLEEEPL